MKYRQLTAEERSALAALRSLGLNKAEIARELGRHRSTVGRELKRNSAPYDGGYRSARAHQRADARRYRSRRNSQFGREEWARVEELLREEWSPEQVSGHLERTRELAISHETIYRHVWRDLKAGGTLHAHLRCARKIGDFASQPGHLARGGLLAYGAQPSAPELPRLRDLAHPPVKDARADPKIFGHFKNWFPQTHKPDGLGFELCGVSFSGHCFHGRLFLYFVVQNLRAPQLYPCAHLRLGPFGGLGQFFESSFRHGFYGSSGNGVGKETRF